MATEHPDASPTQTGSEVDLIERTPSAYDYPLLIKYLLHTPLAHAPRSRRSSTVTSSVTWSATLPCP